MLDIKVFQDGEDGGRLELLGKLDNNSARDLERAVGECSKRYKSIVIDCENLVYVSSAGLRVLKKGYAWIKANGGTFKLINISDDVRSVLDMTGLSLALHITE